MAVKYEIDLNETGREFPHYWELCVGSCHAATVLREDVRRQIRKAHEECGFQYLRFHGLFDDDMSVVLPPMGPGGEEISFFNVDSIFDFLLDIGMKPFVEIGFMPEVYASGTQTCFHYKGNVTMPAEDDKWMNLIRTFGGHLLERYGREEVSTWFFEVWNEPNLRFFFDGTQEDYFHLYEMTARTLKGVDGCFRVGGPATSVNAWIPEFRSFCEEHQVPLDFITTHHYPSDDPLSTMGMNGPGVKGTSPMDPEVMEQMKKLQPMMKKLREKHKDDKEALNKEMMQLYKTYKVNPAGGCLPILVQIPVFIGLYQALLNSIELRHASFIEYLPFTDITWLADLSAADPFYITPLLMGASMFLQQRLTPAAGDPTQQKVMMFMPVIFTVMFINFPAGLVIYWLCNNILSIGQQWWMLRKA